MVKKPTYEELEQIVKTFELEQAKQRQFAEKLQNDCEHLKQLVDQRTVELQKETQKRSRAEKSLKREKDDFYLLFGTTGDIIWEADQNTIYTYVSPQVKDLLGYDPEEMVGKSVFDFMLPDDAERVAQSYRDEIESQKKIILLETGTVHKEGHLVVLETNAVPIFGENGEYQGYRGIDRDITFRKKMEEMLRLSNEKFSVIFRSCPDPIVITTLDERRITDANESFLRLSEYSREEVIGRTVYELNLWVSEEEAERYKNLLGKKGEVHNFECNFKRKTSGSGMGLVSASLFSHAGETYLISILNDITERKQAEAALQKAHLELELQVVRRTAELTKTNEQLKKQIMERKQVEEALRESEKKYLNLFDATPVPTVVINRTGEIIDINKSHLEKIGGGRNKKEDYMGMNILMHPSIEKAGVSELYRKTLEGEFIEAEQVYYPEVTRGSEGYFDIKAAPILDTKGDINSIIVTHEEVTERKQAEDALRESEEKYKTLFANAGDALFFMEVGPENRSWFIECNYRTFALFGCITNDIIGKSPAFVSPEIQPDGKSSVKKAMELTGLVMEGQPQDFQWLHHRYDNKEPFWVEVNLTQITLGGKSNYMQAVVRDITERKRAETLVLELSRQLIASQEDERQMISYELHDSVAQDLSSSRINCEMLLKYKSLTPGARKRISDISGALHKTLISVRDLSYDLRPPGLEKLGLPRVMYQFCEDFSEKTGTRVDFRSAGIEPLNLNYNTKINLYRLLQEGLNNVKKHADSGNVKVRLIASFPKVILLIHDDGKGFDLKERLAKTSSEKKMGLSSMAHRVDLLLGSMDIESIPGKGTKVLIEIPYQDGNIGA